MTFDHALNLVGAVGGAIETGRYVWSRSERLRCAVKVALYRIECLCAGLWRRGPAETPEAPSAPVRERTPMYVPPSRRSYRRSPRPPAAPDHARKPHVAPRVPSTRPSSGLSHVTASPCPRPKPRRDGAAHPSTL